jgi:creatinine amidohydrolase
MPGFYYFNELPRERLNELAPEALIVLPVGATEQHGPHLPTGTDVFAVERIAREASQVAAAEITTILAPTLPFGSSHHHLPFGGSFSLSTETYYRVLVELLESLVAGGFKKVFILNGHGGNSELIQLAARDVARDHPISVAAAPYWTIAWDGLVAAGIHRQGKLPGHAGRFETSLVLAMRPELVVEPRPSRDLAAASGEPRAASPFRAEHHGSWQAMDGYTDSPALGAAEIGEQALQLIVDAVAGAFVAFTNEASAAQSRPEKTVL